MILSRQHVFMVWSLVMYATTRRAVMGFSVRTLSTVGIPSLQAPPQHGSHSTRTATATSSRLLSSSSGDEEKPEMPTPSNGTAAVAEPLVEEDPDQAEIKAAREARK